MSLFEASPTNTHLGVLKGKIDKCLNTEPDCREKFLTSTESPEQKKQSPDPDLYAKLTNSFGILLYNVTHASNRGTFKKMMGEKR